MAFSFEKENIIDPILEKIDPTPNIHELFVQFNRRFFWGKLDMVEVAWSSRQMTSCAGICCFHPSSGHCLIKLSAPLLSLRSRKDMIETLLHEMIHAYLFMTKNYKDRNDHGPEFHKHMYRINKETGTNITVYHTFHDEVRSFQNHVWRCNGPCQKMHPFYGLVRRATNRAPGPYDNWWSSHKMKCNGQFEKIEEPPGYKSKKAGTSKTAPQIKDYFKPVVPKGSNIHTIANISSPASKPTSQPLRDNSPKSGGNHAKPNFHTLNDNPAKYGSNPPKFNFSGKIGGTSKNKGSGNVAVTPSWFGSIPPKNTGGVTGNKGSSTVVVSGRPNSNKPATFVPNRATPPKPSQPTQSTSNGANVQEQMRNVWGNKFSVKRKEPIEDVGKSKKVIMECDDCSTLLAEDELVSHRLTCAGRQTHPCPVCNRPIREGDLEEHLSLCLSDSITEDIFAGDESDADSGETSDKVDCPVCGSAILQNDINSHIDECLTMVALKNNF